MKKTITLFSLVLLLLGVGSAVAANINQMLLPGNLIPKFVDPLPEAGDITVVNATDPATSAVLPGGTPAYNIHMREFQSQILPSTGVPGFPNAGASWVWGYLTDDDVAAGGVRPSYLGPVVVAERGVPAYPTYLNELPLGAASVVQQNLPFDLTLDWANPAPEIDCLVDAAGQPTLTQCIEQGGIVPYTGELPDSVHIHGGEVAPAYDGGPEAWVTQSGVAGFGYPGPVYTYPNAQEEATIWFHPHGFGITRLNVYAGLAGVYPIIDPANPPLATMPAFPQHDIPLIIQDRSFDTNGEIFYNLASNPQPNPNVHPFWIPEFIGDTIVVNGKTWPYLNVEQRQYRFRLLNGSNARFYDLSINYPKIKINKLDKASKITVPMAVIATDDGYLVNAEVTPNVILGPGERYEVIVDFTNVPVNTNLIMANAARTPFPGGAKPTVGGTDTVMQFRVTGPAPVGTTIPKIVQGTPIRPTPIEPIAQGFIPPAVPPAAPAGNIVRQLTLNEVIGAGGPLELVVNNSKYNLLSNDPTSQSLPILPGCTTPACKETELPAVGDTEIWEIINITADAHPMHTHLTSFRVLDRTPFQAATYINQYDALMLANGVVAGGGPPNQYNVRNADGAIGGNPAINSFLDISKRRLAMPYEMSWKDTVIAYPGEVTRIMVRWAPQDAPVASTTAGVNAYPFNPTEVINGVGYVWHCHILDHEDNEMMRRLVVMPERQAIE